MRRIRTVVNRTGVAKRACQRFVVNTTEVQSDSSTPMLSDRFPPQCVPGALLLGVYRSVGIWSGVRTVGMIDFAYICK